MDTIETTTEAAPETESARTHFEHYGFTGTYSPEDNKLRLYSVTRFSDAIKLRVKAAGFRWAPKQKLWVAPRWTPAAADLLEDLCGEIGDEDTSLVDRQAERAERFEGYKENRAADAESARKAVSAITDGIPLGQPILVGHHSERHARKDAERIENGMRKAVKMWETSKYWKARAAGAIRHAKYKELPGVRARRIGVIEADKRKQERSRAKSAKLLAFYTDPRTETINASNGKNMRRALLATHFECGLSYDDSRDFEKGTLSYEDALARALANLRGGIEYRERWIAHCDFRLMYEREMLEEQGASHLLDKAPRPKQLPLCNYRAPKGLDIPNRYNRGTIDHYDQIEMTQAEYAKIWNDYKGTRVIGNSHRVRTAMAGPKRNLMCVFLTDSKVHVPPGDAPPPEPPDFAPRMSREPTPYKAPERTDFDTMKEHLRTGVKIAVAPQLFVSPDTLAHRMVAEARPYPGARILEPSAGTGSLLRALGCPGADYRVVAIEHSCGLTHELVRRYSPRVEVIGGDFLEFTPERIGRFDFIFMNPPFEDGADVRHVLHALTFLEKGGTLKAVMSTRIVSHQDNRTRALRALIEERGGEIDPLPEGTFKESGTGTNTVLVTVE